MGEAIQNVKLLESASAELGIITGQKPITTRAKKAIAGFQVTARYADWGESDLAESTDVGISRSFDFARASTDS